MNISESVCSSGSNMVFDRNQNKWVDIKTVSRLQLIMGNPLLWAIAVVGCAMLLGQVQ